MIEAKDLRKVYKTKKGVVVNALDGVSVKLPDTGMVFILGKSGSGKSTLLNVLGGLDSFDSGEIIIKGTSAKDFKQRHYDSYRNTYIGFIFQEYNVLDELTVGANVALAIELQGRKATNEEINSILKEVDLDGYGSRKPNELSGGQKQRVAIARALVKKPEIIMADEPTGALDSATGKQVFDTLKKLSRDKLVLIVSHDREFSEQYADRIIELKDGVIISDVEKEKTSYDEADFAEAETDDSITYEDGEITLKPGYTLTEEDRIAINEYLASIATGAKIKVGNAKLKKKFSAKDFVPTDESKIVSNKKGDFKLIKSKLSMKNAFKLGSGALNHKKVRLVFTILLSLVSFTLFGLADTIAAYDSIGTATSSIYDTGVDYASYVKMIKRTSGDYSYWVSDNTYLTPSDVELIKTETGRDVVGVFKKDVQLSYSQNIGKEEVDGMDPEVLYTDYFSGLTPINQTLMQDHGFTLLAGKLPEAGKNEIAITKYTYDYFNKVGHVEFNDQGNVESKIEKPEDIIGKTLTLDLEYNKSTIYTVTAVIDTNFDYSRYEKLASEDAQFTVSAIESMALTQELESAQRYSFACIGFVNEKLISDILAEREGKAESLNGAGNLTLYTVHDDSFTEPWEIHGEDGSNIISSTYVGALNSLTKVKDVVWFGSPVTELADNQIIISSSALSQMVSGGGHGGSPEVWYNSEKLVGFEKTLYDGHQDGSLSFENYYPYSLSDMFRGAKYFAAYKYAYNNLAAARAAVVEQYMANNEGATEEEIINNYGLQSDASVYNRFATMCNDGEITGIITDTHANEYIDSLIQTYGLAEYKLSDSIRNALLKKFEYGGKTFESYESGNLLFNFQISGNVDNIIARKYAAENFGDAVQYHKLKTQTDHISADKNSIGWVIDNYANYLQGYDDKVPDGFDTTASENFAEYKMTTLVSLYNSTSTDDAKRVMSLYSYVGGGEQVIKNVAIVGVYLDNNSGYSYEQTLVVSEGVMNMLFGANRGGIYSYVVGVMPEDRVGVNEIVKFSKTYRNEAGDVKYNLTNNVTSQLDMVDEILDMLGQIFLYVGIGFAVFASLMLTNFISTSITHKKQDIGILRAIGSRSNDVFRIFFAESFIIAMINYVLSLAGTISVTIVINSVLRNDAGLLITFLNFGIRQIGLLLLVSLAVAFIATFFPVKKIASMKPIDAIKNRK